MKQQFLMITGKRWFQSSYGNTYFSARAYLDGRFIDHIDYEYGYGDQYADSMLRKLTDDKIIPPRKQYDNGLPSEAWWQWSERTGIKVRFDVSDVSRKKDLGS